VSRKRPEKTADGLMTLGHVIELDPTDVQANALARAAGCARFTYNWALAEWKADVAAGKRPVVDDIKKRYNALKEELYPWLYESPKDANQQAFADFSAGVEAYWQSRIGKRKGKRVGFPVFKRRGQYDAFYVSNDKFEFFDDRMAVRLPVIGELKIHERLRLPGKILGARVFRKADRWFLSVQVRGEFRHPTVSRNGIDGFDAGIKHAVVSSRGDVYDAPKPLASILRRLRRESRSLQRKEKKSENRKKAVLRVARLHRRVANVRNEFLQQLTTILCRENQVVVIEDLNVAGMLRNHKLARALMDVGLGRFRQLMLYKGPIYDCLVILADRWFPSTKRCSRCGHLKDEMPLGERVYRCEKCGLVMDRDENAAKNLALYPRLAGKITPTMWALLQGGDCTPWSEIPKTADAAPVTEPRRDRPSTQRRESARQGRSATQEPSHVH
jgi:putative transposase